MYIFPPVVRLWIGPWFNTAHHFLRLLRDNPDGRRFEVLGSSHDAYSPVLQACDRRFPEPELDGPEYAEYCLDLCRRQGVDVFVPGYKKFLAVAPRLADFAALGTRVLLHPDPAVLRVLHDKAATYAALAPTGHIALPAYRLVETAEVFRDACQELHNRGHRLCFKPNAGQGGMGFRVLDDTPPDASALAGYAPGNRLDYALAESLLAAQPNFPPLLVCEYLEGPEYSIDCLAYRGRLYAAIPRRKVDARLRYLEDHPGLIEIARRVAEFFGLSYLFNIQVKYQDGVPKLVEINPRMSGGLYFACLAGANLPYLALKLLYGEDIEVPPLRLDRMAGEVGAAVLFAQGGDGAATV